MKGTISVCIGVAILLAAAGLAQATVYNVGPGQTYTNVNDVPWESLAAGDTVNIHYRATPYKEKFGVFTQGTEANPITVHGVPDAGGNLPVIDGDGATSRSVTYLDYWSETRQVVKVGGSSKPPSDATNPPTYIVIENLEIKSGRDPYTFTDKNGVQQTYTTNASSIRVEVGQHVTIRNCILHDSANNFLTSGTSGEILVEGCYNYDGGYGAAEHNNYTESKGITFQYNRHGPLRTSGTANEGINLKDRSCGTIVRYNWIEGGVRQVNLVESYDYADIRDDPRYGHDRVYGNVLIMLANANGNESFLFGGDMGTAYEQYYRIGPLQAYNNTVISKRTDQSRFIRLKTSAQIANLVNNIYYVPAGSCIILSSSIGTCTTSHNWFQSGYNLSGATEDGTNISGTAPGFADYANGDFHLTSGSACRDAGGSLPSEVLPDYNVVEQYVKHQGHEARPSDGTFDIGAYEYYSGPTPLDITTTSLPDGAVGVFYSQTLQATGGTTPYSWSIVSGSLPGGLFLNSSTGVISGTPTTVETSNFTARVTDSASPAGTDDQALAINVVTEPTYRFASADAETATSSTTYVNKASLAFTPAAADDYLVLAQAEFKPMATSSSGLVRMTIDGTTEAEARMEPQSNTQYITFDASKFVNLGVAAHTINIDYCSSSSKNNNYIRNARIVAIRKAALAVSSAAADSAVNLTTALTDYVTLNFTPASAGDYLLVWSAELYGNSTTNSTRVQAKLNGGAADESTVRSKDTTDWWPFASFSVANFGASQQTMTIAAAKVAGNATHQIRRARVTAIRLTGGRFASYQYAADDSESTTTSSTYVQKLTKSWTAGTAGTWLVLSSFRLTNSSTSYNTWAEVQLDDATVTAESGRRPVNTTDYMNAGCVDVRNLAAGTRRADVDFRSSSAAATAKIKNVHLVAVPLQ